MEKGNHFEVYTFRGVVPHKSFVVFFTVFLNSLAIDLISCNFSLIFALFQTESDLCLGGGGGRGKTLEWEAAT